MTTDAKTPAEIELETALMSLGGESPIETYTEEGYRIWLRSVTARIVYAALDGVAPTSTHDELRATLRGRMATVFDNNYGSADWVLAGYPWPRQL
jgi:hypothetical protein